VQSNEVYCVCEETKSIASSDNGLATFEGQNTKRQNKKNNQHKENTNKENGKEMFQIFWECNANGRKLLPNGFYIKYIMGTHHTAEECQGNNGKKEHCKT
jgi:hypothetical protein